MGIKFSNNAEGTLTAGVGSGDTTNMTLTAGDGLLFPTIVLASGNYFYATLVNQAGAREIVNITEHQEGTDVFQTFVRAQDDTDAVAFEIGDKVQIRFPKIILEEFRDDIVTNAADIATNVSDIAAAVAKSTADEQVLYGPSGLTMYMYNPVGEIPTGWSAKSGPADCLLAIAGGSNAYNVAGENLAGSWTPTGHVHTIAHTHDITHTHTMPTHLHSTPGHVLSIAEMPAHTHSYNVATGVHNHDGGAGSVYYVAPSTTGSAGGNASHAHGNTGSTDPGDTNASSASDTGASDTANAGSSKEPSTDRPYAAVGLLIERD
jgi:hypothetical protein